MAFYKCANLSSITMPANITTIGVQMFGNCSSLRQVNVPEGVISISKGAFLSAGSLLKLQFLQL
jgi:hypothetical protein